MKSWPQLAWARNSEPRVLASVAIAQLRHPQVVAANAINDPVFAGDTARPIPLKRMLQRLRFSDAAIRIPQHVFNKLVTAFECLRICFLPIEIFIPSVRREDKIHASSFSFLRTPLPLSNDSIDRKSRFAFSGDRNKCAVFSRDSYSASEGITTDWSRFRVIATGAWSSHTRLIVDARFSRAAVYVIDFISGQDTVHAGAMSTRQRLRPVAR